MKKRRWYVKRESWPCPLIGSVDVDDIDVALQIARRKFGHHVFVSSSNAPTGRQPLKVTYGWPT